jgi:hypothetical protein
MAPSVHGLVYQQPVHDEQSGIAAQHVPHETSPDSAAHTLTNFRGRGYNRDLWKIFAFDAVLQR